MFLPRKGIALGAGAKWRLQPCSQNNRGRPMIKTER